MNGTALTNLTGLDNLTSVGGTLSIIGNPSLTHLAGLDKLSSVEGSVQITENASFDCGPYNTEPYELPFFPVTYSGRNLVDCVTE